MVSAWCSPAAEVVEIHSDDTISTPAGEWHWHGASPDHFMAHFSLTEDPAEGLATQWGDHVTDEEYGPCSGA